MLNALWTPFSYQDAAIMTIVVPAAMLKLAPSWYVGATSLLGSLVGVAAMAVPPVAGWLSDKLRRRGGSRRLFVAAGLAIDVAALFALSYAQTLFWFATLLVVATIGANIALAAYQALLPESVPRKHWGAVSGIRGGATLLGTVLGLALGGLLPAYHDTLLVGAILVAACGFSLFAIGEGDYTSEEHATVRDWHDFMVVFAARLLVFFGLILLQTFVLLYFRDIQKVGDPSAGTALYGFCALLGAVGSSVYLGILSDRAPRKLVTALAGVPMAIATIGFALAPELKWMLPFAVLFGVGFGGVLSCGWALAMDTIPELRDVARDLGLWGIATNLPNAVAPAVGGWLIWFFHGTRDGYQAVFGLAGFCFVLASLSVLRVGRRPISSFWGWPSRVAAYTLQYVWLRSAYRVRNFGNVPRRRGPTLIVANHQHDLESAAIVSTTGVHSGPWRHGLFMACSRRMYEPGFMALRIPWLSWALRRWNSGPLFMSLGMLPLEHELASREVSALSWSVQRRHGVMLLSDVFNENVAGLFPPGTKTSDLWNPQLFAVSRTLVKLTTLKDPYKREVLEETRKGIEEDLARMENVVRRGGTFYLTPEGRYSVDGRIGPMRGAVDRLAPLATTYLCGVSYDPFVGKRLSMLYQVQRLDPPVGSGKAELMTHQLAAIRPVTTSQVLSAWLAGRTEPFTFDDAVRAVNERLATLPSPLMVDPELERNPQRMVRAALKRMPELQILETLEPANVPVERQRYRLAAVRKHPQFPLVNDAVAFLATVLEETIANARYSKVMAAL